IRLFKTLGKRSSSINNRQTLVTAGGQALHQPERLLFSAAPCFFGSHVSDSKRRFSHEVSCPGSLVYKPQAFFEAGPWAQIFGRPARPRFVRTCRPTRDRLTIAKLLCSSPRDLGGGPKAPFLPAQLIPANSQPTFPPPAGPPPSTRDKRAKFPRCQ